MIQKIGIGKIVLIALIFIASPVVKAQEVMGVKVGGPFSTFDRLIKDKGCTVISPLKDNIAGYSGVVGSYDVKLYVSLTPITKQVWKAVLFFEEHNSFSSLNNQYQILVDALTNKYGNPSKVFNFFDNPFELGDGYELTAVGANKCHYATFWNSDDHSDWSIWIEIDTKKSVIIHYQNSKASGLFKQESDQLLQDGL